ncbi:MAG: hypothetical protein AB7G11_13395 [Phycisphaerales bacterium]
MLITAAAGILAMLGCHQAPPDATREEAIAYATAMLIHDRSIRSLEWYQEIVRQPDPGGPLETVQTAREGFDELGRSYQHWVVTFPEPDGSVHAWKPSYSSDGVTTVAFDPANPETLKRFPDPEPTGYPTPPLLLGRYIEATGKRRLGERLIEAPSLRIERAMDSDGVVRLSAQLAINNVVSIVHVDIDSGKSYAPTRIEVDDVLAGRPHEIIYVTAFERYVPSHAPINCDACPDAIWIPVKGRRETYMLKETDENRAGFKRLREAIERSGVNSDGVNPLDPATQAAYRAAILEAFGPEGVPYVPLVPHLHLAKCVVFSLNSRIDESAFRSTDASGLPQANLYLNINAKGEPFDDPDADLAERERSKPDAQAPVRGRPAERAPSNKE